MSHPAATLPVDHDHAHRSPQRRLELAIASLEQADALIHAAGTLRQSGEVALGLHSSVLDYVQRMERDAAEMFAEVEFLGFDATTLRRYL